MKKHTLHVCTNCPHDAAKGHKTGRKLYHHLAEVIADDPLLSSQMHIAEVTCMGGCDKPHAIAVTATDKQSVLFNEIPVPLSDDWLADIKTYLKSFIDSDTGRVNYKKRPKLMKDNLLIRIPCAKKETP